MHPVILGLAVALLTAPIGALAQGTAAPDIAKCPKLAAEETADRARTTALAIPAQFRQIARADVNHVAVATLAGGTVCISTAAMESIDGVRLSSDGRFFHFQWNGNEAGGYIMVDRSGRGQSADTGAIPTFSPSRTRFASIEISESGFGSLNGFLVMAVDSAGMRQIAKLENIPMLVDWRIHDWLGENCVNLSGVRQQDVPKDWDRLPKARRTLYVARSTARGWTFTASKTGCARQ